MARGQKKFLYGLFYLVIFGLIVLAFLPAPEKPAPEPAADKILPLQTQIDSAKLFRSESAERLVIIAGVRNPNSDYGVSRFSYEFDILRKDGGIFKTISGE